MILIDTSAWIEFLRNTGSPTCQRVDDLLDSQVATCDVIRMEVLAGASSETHLADLRGLLARAVALPTSSAHYDQAAAIYRGGRAQGRTVRRLTDCLIAAVALDNDVPVLHLDRDFDAIAQMSDLALDHHA